MPKGKSKAKNPEIYRHDYDEEVWRAQQRLASQAVAHNRGGTHRVKDEHLTNTRYDHMNHAELYARTKEAGLFEKNMKKRDMARALADKMRADRVANKRREKEAAKKKEEEDERKRNELAERERAKKEKARKIEERRQREAEGEPIDGDEWDWDDEEEEESERQHGLGHGRIIQDDSESPTTTTTATSEAIFSPIHPTQTLRIFEWPASNSPARSPKLPDTPYSTESGNERFFPLPRRLPYAAMSVVTTLSQETLRLPGDNYRDDVDPDFVPILSEHTKDCARNGVLINQLSDAVIESATQWAGRTLVQWWNGHMYFNLPARKPEVKLTDVYTKWKKKKERTGKTKPEDPKISSIQRQKDQRQKMLDVYAASEYRPLVGYRPSYLDYPKFDGIEREKSMDNLFYIRFPHVDLPHYFFWADPEEWADPTTPNPEWSAPSASEALRPDSYLLYIRRELRRGHYRPVILVAKPNEYIEVREKLPVPGKFLDSAKAPKASAYEIAIWRFERDLYRNGWKITMVRLREKWLEEGKKKQWDILTRQLPWVYPSGILPNAPPSGLKHEPVGLCLAEKFARVEVFDENRLVEPILGDEDWTRDDDSYWKVVERDQEPEEDKTDEPSGATADASQHLERRSSEVLAWMDELVSPPAASTRHNKTR